MNKLQLKLIIILLLSTEYTYTQEVFKFDSISHKLNNSVIVKFDSLSKKDLYQGTLKWILLNYSSEKVIAAKLENELIKIDGITNAFMIFTAGKRENNVNLKHSILFEFKDNKMKIYVSKIETFVDESPGTTQNVMNLEEWYDSEGHFRNKYLTEMPKNIEDNLNHIILKLKEYIITRNKAKDW